MAPYSRSDPHQEGGSQKLWEDGQRIFRRGSRLDVKGKKRAVLIVQPAARHPSRSILDHLAHEYELRDDLESTWAARPLELLRDGGRTVLVIEDVGGEPLGGLIGPPMELGRFLRLAIAIAAAVGKLHERGLIHKDIKPANILVDVAAGEAWLTGFGIATRFPRERQSPSPPETIAGTLAYMAPEQTGRMNRSIDSRGDLYALGVTFYQMLTGELPFTAPDPTGWVHCHLAMRPAPPSERVKEIPAAISAIVLKLLAKRAEERYQTAAGLERDLRHCQTEWNAGRRVGDFQIGQRDTSDKLLIPEKLYGREREVATLLAAFGRVVEGGAPEWVLVSGYSGIGKSSVVNELQPALAARRGLFASGKFDQFKREIPYATLAQAFQSLIRPLLGKSESDLAPWRDSLRELLGPNAGLIADLLPEVKLVIGEPAAVPELVPQDARRRFQMVFRRFLAMFARPGQPLALFLDDLQWLDAATLELLEDLVTHPDVRDLLLIGAYRDNEVDAAHPLTRTLDRIRRAGAPVREIVLAPLTREDVRWLVADTLFCDRERAASLADLVQEKTAGNPFFVNQFLSELVEEELLTFDHRALSWSWRPARIHAKGYTDNVLDFMAAKLSRLPVDAQKALRQLACLGNEAGPALVSVVAGDSREELQRDLHEALRAGLVLNSEGSYRFLHDRVQQAAYCLIPEAHRAEAHLRIGRLLAAHIPPEQRAEAIFEIVNQLNRGASLITSREEREQLAEFNLAAGKRAKASSAYASALTYLGAGAAMLPEDAWDRRQELAFELELHPADCEVCIGALPAAGKRLAALAARAVGTLQRCAVARRRVDLYTMLGEAEQAVAVALECLRHIGIDLPAHPTEMEARAEYERIWSLLGGRDIEDVVDLPLMRDPEALAMLEVLVRASMPALYTDQNLYASSVCRAANLSLERGNNEVAPYSYAIVGLIAGARFGHHDRGYRLAKMACALIERHGWKHVGGRTYFFFAAVIPWTRPLAEKIAAARRAFELAKEHGDPAFAGFASRAITTALFALGHPLEQVERQAEEEIEFARKFGFYLAKVSPPLALLRTLRGKTTEFGSFGDEHLTEDSFEQRLASHRPAHAFLETYYWVRKLRARFFAGDYASAVEAADKAERWYGTCATLELFLTETADLHFYAALSRAARCEASGRDAFPEIGKVLRRHARKFEGWAANCPQNFEDRAALVGAEIARIEGRELDAERSYEAAIKSARANGFVHNEAIANELAARFHAARGFETISNAYLREARSCYLRWGADGKVRQLDRLHPRLRQDERSREPTGTIETPIQQLDLATVIKVSQAVSGEMALEKLIERLMRAAIEHAGAERGLLIRPRGEELLTDAEATSRGELVAVQVWEGSSRPDVALPESLVRYATRTREILILGDASSQNSFSGDPYIGRRRARSILCLPLINQGKLIGVLYLENNLAPHVFTPDRVTVLKVLASQAAISLVNSRLYRDLADREGKIRRLVDANIMGIYTWRLDGVILEANDALLRMLRYDREDVVSGRLRLTGMTPSELRERDELVVAELRSTGSFQPFEKEFFRKDGSRIPVLIGGALFEHGGVDGVAFVLDLTERNRAEQALRELESNFAHMNRLSTMGEFAASLSHEILHPIATARNNARAGMRFLEMNPPNLDEVREALGCVVMDVDRAKDIVGRVRDHIKKAPPRRELFDLDEAVRDTLAMVRGAIAGNSIAVDTHLTEKMILVRGDRVQLQQVVVNLILNAVEAMSADENGARKLSIRTEQVHADGGVLVQVRDSGPGIDWRNVERIFEPFYTTKISGVGMGLSICRSIINGHGGRLWAEPNEPRGAVFQFILPPAQEGS